MSIIGFGLVAFALYHYVYKYFVSFNNESFPIEGRTAGGDSIALDGIDTVGIDIIPSPELGSSTEELLPAVAFSRADVTISTIEEAALEGEVAAAAVLADNLTDNAPSAAEATDMDDDQTARHLTDVTVALTDEEQQQSYL